MQRRTRIIIAVVAVIIIVLIALFLWWLFNRSNLSLIVNQNTNQPPPQEQLPSASTGLPPDATVLTPEKKLEATLTAIAMTFAERFGSYSNQGSYTNLDDSKSLMTIRMIAWSENYKASHPIETNAPYSGVSTKALSAKVMSSDEATGRAEVTVVTQRQESQGTTINPRITYQSLKLSMVREGSEWKIDSAEWQ